MQDNPLVTMAMNSMLKALNIKPEQMTEMINTFVNLGREANNSLARIEAQNKRILELLGDKGNDGNSSGDGQRVIGNGSGNS
jgi:hypothetical protein